eukprot:TRINITY_DN28931_c0_g1_i1.p1 TRINITY_DN28931_c0_g1~~TRINITY_DN28931_c0_g1_i1.p1  ORF type:complete len:163 (+),score=16.87 TRINITY_DN28931_c0_g1_i1:192-680(+)
MAIAERQHTALTAPAVAGECVKAGYLEKQADRCSCSCLGKVYNVRFVVLKGGYLYKFSNPESTSTLGRPIALLGSKIVDKTDNTFTLSTFPKDYVFRAGDNAELEAWFSAILDQTQLVLKQEKGHAEVAPADVWSNKLAFESLDRKHRIQAQKTRDADFAMM